MSDTTTPQNISDTARWVAWYRALESERVDAWFRDPLARRLAGQRGERIAEGMPFANRNAWSFVARTALIDRFIAESIQQGANLVVNLAAGLDTRPYRRSITSLRIMPAAQRELLGHRLGPCESAGPSLGRKVRPA